MVRLVHRFPKGMKGSPDQRDLPHAIGKNLRTRIYRPRAEDRDKIYQFLQERLRKNIGEKMAGETRRPDDVILSSSLFSPRGRLSGSPRSELFPDPYPRPEWSAPLFAAGNRIRGTAPGLPMDEMEMPTPRRRALLWSASVRRGVSGTVPVISIPWSVAVGGSGFGWPG